MICGVDDPLAAELRLHGVTPAEYLEAVRKGQGPEGVLKFCEEHTQLAAEACEELQEALQERGALL